MKKAISGSVSLFAFFLLVTVGILGWSNEVQAGDICYCHNTSSGSHTICTSNPALQNAHEVNHGDSPFGCECGNGTCEAGLGETCSTCSQDCGTCTLCGDGALDAGEQCDDGDTSSGDCCDSGCQFEAQGSSCFDGDPCTNPDACDGGGICAAGPVDCSNCLDANGNGVCDEEEGPLAEEPDVPPPSGTPGPLGVAAGRNCHLSQAENVMPDVTGGAGFLVVALLLGVFRLVRKTAA